MSERICAEPYYIRESLIKAKRSFQADENPSLRRLRNVLISVSLDSERLFSMEDIEIIDLYWKRDESAITETSQKYGGLCLSIAKNVLSVTQDAEECVNDTYMTAWNSIPPHKPTKLGAWLGRVVRNIAINLWNKNHCQKRYSGMDAILSELEDCIPSPATVENELDSEELTRFIDDWLNSLEPSEKSIFVKRYWYGESVISIAKELNAVPARIADKMFRLRKNLKACLEKEGYSI